MEFITAAEYAKKHNITPRSVTRYASSGKFPGAYKAGRTWLIPADSSVPISSKSSAAAVKASEKSAIEDSNEFKEFRFPIFQFTEYYHKRHELNSQEKVVYDAIMLFYKGEYKEAVIMLENLLKRNDYPAYFRAGIFYLLCENSLFLGDIQRFSKYIHSFLTMLEEDFPYKEEMSLLIPFVEAICKDQDAALQFELKLDYEYHPDIYSFAHLQNLFKLNLQVLKEGPMADTATLALIYKSICHRNIYLLNQRMDYFLAIIYHFTENTELKTKHIKNMIKIAREHEAYSILGYCYIFFSNHFMDELNKEPPEFRNRIISIGENLKKSWMKIKAHFNNKIPAEDLSIKEINLLIAINKGLSNKEIAAKFNYSVATIAKKITDIYFKIGISSRKEVSAYVNKYIILCSE